MMSSVLQDWIDLEGPTDGEIIQSASSWLDLRGYQDLFLYLDVRAVASQVRMHYQTAPTPDEVLFQNMVADFAVVVNTGPTITKVLLSRNPTLPPAAFVRWRLTITGGNAWKAVFRIHCVAKRRGW